MYLNIYLFWIGSISFPKKNGSIILVMLPFTRLIPTLVGFIGGGEPHLSFPLSISCDNIYKTEGSSTPLCLWKQLLRSVFWQVPTLLYFYVLTQWYLIYFPLCHKYHYNNYVLKCYTSSPLLIVWYFSCYLMLQNGIILVYV